MSYIDKNLLAEERIIFRTKKHLLVFLLPVIVTFLAVLAYTYMLHSPILTPVKWVPGALMLIFWAYAGLEYVTSDYAVTNKRIMMREGLFNQHAKEVRLSAIAQVVVDQTLLGRMLQYGTVSINAFGAYDSFRLIADPYKFQYFVNQQLDLLVK